MVSLFPFDSESGNILSNHNCPVSEWLTGGKRNAKSKEI
jgi:hypothetical protein